MILQLLRQIYPDISYDKISGDKKKDYKQMMKFEFVCAKGKSFNFQAFF